MELLPCQFTIFYVKALESKNVSLIDIQGLLQKYRNALHSCSSAYKTVWSFEGMNLNASEQIVGKAVHVTRKKLAAFKSRVVFYPV